MMQKSMPGLSHTSLKAVNALHYFTLRRQLSINNRVRHGYSLSLPEKSEQNGAGRSHRFLRSLGAPGLTRQTFRRVRCFLTANHSGTVGHCGSSQICIVPFHQASESDASCRTNKMCGTTRLHLRVPRPSSMFAPKTSSRPAQSLMKCRPLRIARHRVVKCSETRNLTITAK